MSSLSPANGRVRFYSASAGNSRSGPEKALQTAAAEAVLTPYGFNVFPPVSRCMKYQKSPPSTLRRKGIVENAALFVTICDTAFHCVRVILDVDTVAGLDSDVIHSQLS